MADEKQAQQRREAEQGQEQRQARQQPGETSAKAQEQAQAGREAQAQAAEGEVRVDPEPLAGVATAGVAQAGGPQPYEVLVESDPYAHESAPDGQPGPILPEDAKVAMEARARAGVPEPPKAGEGSSTLWDTPGGYQVTYPGTTPEDVAVLQSQQGPGYPKAQEQFGTGAENRHVAGPKPGSTK